MAARSEVTTVSERPTPVLLYVVHCNFPLSITDCFPSLKFYFRCPFFFFITIYYSKNKSFGVGEPWGEKAEIHFFVQILAQFVPIYASFETSRVFVRHLVRPVIACQTNQEKITKKGQVPLKLFVAPPGHATGA